MRRSLLPVLAIVVAACGAAPSPEPADTLAFLTGTWTSDEKGFVTVERWTPLPDGTLLGSGTASANGAILFAETLAIVPQGSKLAYVAWPNGQDVAVFPETDRSTTSVTFENDQHPFPRKLTYVRVDPDTLEVTADGVEQDGAPRHESWRLVRAPGSSVTPPRAP